MSEVVLEGVRKSYRGPRRGSTIVAVDGLDLAVADGEFLAIVGPSGCGKTTTLRIIAGLERPDAGHVRLGARSMDGVAPEDRDVAMVFQNGGLYPHMTVRANLEFPLRMRRVPAPTRLARARAVAELVGVSHLLDRRPGALSGGEHQRVALAKALVREPVCFLLDEPLASLDLGLRLRLRSELKSLHAKLGRTTILVTHDQEEAMALGDRLAVMRDGRLQQVASPIEVYRRPANRFVASFIGAPPMNFVEGTLERADAAVRLVADGFVVALPAPIDDLAPPDSSVVLGIRPEALRFVAPATPNSLVLTARVEVVEPLGDRSDVVCRLEGGQRMVARVAAAAAPAPGAVVTLSADGADACLFEPGPDGMALR